MDDPAKSAKATAILTLVGFINIPIIKFSVDWWNTLHQPASVLRMGGSTIDPSLLWPLLVMAIGFTLLFFTLHMMAMRNEIWRRRVIAMRRVAARSAERRVSAMIGHTAFILASYGASFVVLAGLIGWIFIDQRIQRQALQELEITRCPPPVGDEDGYCIVMGAS